MIYFIFNLCFVHVCYIRVIPTHRMCRGWLYETCPRYCNAIKSIRFMYKLDVYWSIKLDRPHTRYPRTLNVPIKVNHFTYCAVQNNIFTSIMVYAWRIHVEYILYHYHYHISDVILTILRGHNVQPLPHNGFSIQAILRAI